MLWQYSEIQKENIALPVIKITEEANSETFEIVKEDNIKKVQKVTQPVGYEIIQEDGVYYLGTLLSRDIENFEVLGGAYAKDSLKVYFYHDEVLDVDIKSFVLLTDHIAKDRYQAYVGSSPIKEADLTSFEAVGGMISKDKNKVFLADEPLESIDSATIDFINERYIKDKNGVYYIFEAHSGAKQDENRADGYRKILNADKETFVSFSKSPCYAYDKNNVYYRGDLMEAADLETFKIVKDDYAKDKNNVYYQDIIIQNVDAPTFRLFVSEYMPNSGGTLSWPLVDFYIDKNNLLEMNRKDANFLILNADIETLEFVTTGSYSFYFKDKNNFYWLRDGGSNSVIINNCKYCLGEELIGDCLDGCR